MIKNRKIIIIIIITWKTIINKTADYTRTIIIPIYTSGGIAKLPKSKWINLYDPTGPCQVLAHGSTLISPTCSYRPTRIPINLRAHPRLSTITTRRPPTCNNSWKRKVFRGAGRHFSADKEALERSLARWSVVLKVAIRPPSHCLRVGNSLKAYLRTHKHIHIYTTGVPGVSYANYIMKPLVFLIKPWFRP